MNNKGTDFRNSLQVNLYEINDTQRVEEYNKFVESQKKPFIDYINFVNSVLCILKHYRIVSDFTRFLARIKAEESAIANDNVKEKALDDVFGLEIDSATPGEYAFLAVLLTSSLIPTKVATHNKPNGYLAYHYSGYPIKGKIRPTFEEMLRTEYEHTAFLEKYMKYIKLPENPKEREEKIKVAREYYKYFCEHLNSYISNIKKTIDENRLNELKRLLENEEKRYEQVKKDMNDPDYFPIMECQFKTIQTAIESNIGSANHGNYKGENIQKIQEEYDSNGRLPTSRLPKMYKSDIEKDKNGCIINPKLLSTEETIRILYPSIILKQSVPQREV